MRQNLLNLGRQNQQKHVTPLIQTQNLISWTYVSFSTWQVHFSVNLVCESELLQSNRKNHSYL